MLNEAYDFHNGLKSFTQLRGSQLNGTCLIHPAVWARPEGFEAHIKLAADQIAN